jgi:hypothetical protein
MYNGQTYLFTPKPFIAELISKRNGEITIRSAVGKNSVSIKTDSLFERFNVSNPPLIRHNAVSLGYNFEKGIWEDNFKRGSSDSPRESSSLERQNAVYPSAEYDDTSDLPDSPDSGKRKRTEGGKRSRKSRKSKKSRKSRRSRK